MFELKFAAEVSDLTGTWAVSVLSLAGPDMWVWPRETKVSLPWYMTQVLHFQHWLKNQAWASQVNCMNCDKGTEFSLSEDHGIAVYSRDIHMVLRV